MVDEILKRESTTAQNVSRFEVCDRCTEKYSTVYWSELNFESCNGGGVVEQAKGSTKDEESEGGKRQWC